MKSSQKSCKIWFLVTGFGLSVVISSLLACIGKDMARQSNSDLPAGLNDSADGGPYHNAGLDRPTLVSHSVLSAMSRVPRHLFVPQSVKKLAYEDRALPIGSGQTISQPYIVALMTQEANVSTGSKVLEIGTGSGYQSAVLSELGARVFSIEIVPELAQRAADTLRSLGYTSVNVRNGDGWLGWEEEAPFDAILVTAAAPRPPENLIAQLADKGRMIIPIETEESDGEVLMLIERDGADIITKTLGPVKFVPLTGSARDSIDIPVSNGGVDVLQTLKGEKPIQTPISSSAEKKIK